MKQFSNSYIFLFAVVMVVTVAAVLSVVAMLLQPKQEHNMEVAKMQRILASLHVQSDAVTAPELFDRYITDMKAINTGGKELEGVDPFEIDMKVEMRKDLENRVVPVFIAAPEDSVAVYIFPLEGKGLWGPIYGYLAVEGDGNTVYGANFDHDKETPGLGAEINTLWFQNQFVGEKLKQDGEYTYITIVKGSSEPSNKHAVDGISGGTITSKGLEETIVDCMRNYESYLNKIKN